MKMYLYLIAMVLSATAWAAEPAADNMPAAGTSTATQAAEPQAEQAPADSAEQNSAGTEAPAADAGQNAANDAAEQSGFSKGSVVRSAFATEIKDREPVDKLNGAKTDDSHVYYFTELRDMSGQTAVHRWEHNGKVAAEVKFKVRGPRWRVWSSKTFAPGATGEWKVSVLNGAGQVIAEDQLNYTGPAPQTQSEPAATTEDSQPASTDDSQPASQEMAPAQDAMPK